jgi:hypothetical protein
VNCSRPPHIFLKSHAHFIFKQKDSELEWMSSMYEELKKDQASMKSNKTQEYSDKNRGKTFI